MTTAKMAHFAERMQTHVTGQLS